MALGLFKKKKEGTAPPVAGGQKKDEQGSVSPEQRPAQAAGSVAPALHAIIHAYMSEKSSRGNAFGQYTFVVERRATKRDISRAISRLYNVSVSAVKIMNMPEKRKDIGRHPGFRPGFKKAVVVLRKGQQITQLTP